MRVLKLSVVAILGSMVFTACSKEPSSPASSAPPSNGAAAAPAKVYASVKDALADVPKEFVPTKADEKPTSEQIDKIKDWIIENRSGCQMVLSGTVSRVLTREDGTVLVNLDVPTTVEGLNMTKMDLSIDAIFAKGDAAAVANVKKGDNVTVAGASSISYEPDSYSFIVDMSDSKLK